MLKSTYIPPPPLPPGWTEHKAPTGLSLYDGRINCVYLTIDRPHILLQLADQAIYIYQAATD